MTPEELAEAGARTARTTRVAQGLPEHVTDREALAKTARVIKASRAARRNAAEAQRAELQHGLLVGSRQAAALCGVSQSTFNLWRQQGRIPPEVISAERFGGWPRYSRVQLERWLAGDLDEACPEPPAGVERPEPRVTDVAGAASYLATTAHHIRELVYRREIPHFHVGQLLRFDLRDLDRWLEANRTEAT